MAFIISDKGFLKDIIFDKDASIQAFKETKTKRQIFSFIWVTEISEAKDYSKKYATNAVLNHKLNAFVWNPFFETPQQPKWGIVFINEQYINGNKVKINCWECTRVSISPKSDWKFLVDLKSSPDNRELFDTEKEALQACVIKNKAMFANTQDYIRSQEVKLADMTAKKFGL